MGERRKNSIVKSPLLQTCDVDLEDFKPGPFTMVIFGGAGDLTTRKLLPTLFSLSKEKVIQDFSVIGFGLPEMSDQAYRTLAKESIKKFSSSEPPEKDLDSFAKHLFYQTADLADDKAYVKLCSQLRELSKGDNLIYYLAVPPGVVPLIIDKLNSNSLCRDKKGSKLVVEKPFGTSRETAVKLNSCISKAFDEKQIYRIDHYLGKETVQNIIFFRFGNSIFEPVWNRNFIDHVQITVAEDLGVENRALFYEKAGVLRDIVQNHIMQLIALVAMEPPVGFEADAIRDEKVQVLRSIHRMDAKYIHDHTVIGQYASGEINGKIVPAYRKEDKVSNESITPTFFAGKFHIDNWRWADVPFYVRTGKRLAKRVTEIAIQFKRPPLKLLGRSCDIIEPNTLVMKIQPQEEISLRFSVKYPGAGNQPYPVDMVFNYEKAFKVKSHQAYERLLIDCMKGDLTLFARQDGIEAMWAVVDPVIDECSKMATEDIPQYPAGSWGPKEAEMFIEDEGRSWREL